MAGESAPQHWFPGAAVMKYHSPDSFCLGNVSFSSFRGWKARALAGEMSLGSSWLFAIGDHLPVLIIASLHRDLGQNSPS